MPNACTDGYLVQVGPAFLHAPTVVAHFLYQVVTMQQSLLDYRWAQHHRQRNRSSANSSYYGQAHMTHAVRDAGRVSCSDCHAKSSSTLGRLKKNLEGLLLLRCCSYWGLYVEGCHLLFVGFGAAIRTVYMQASLDASGVVRTLNALPPFHMVYL